MTCLLHYLDYTVKRHRVATVAESRVKVGIQRACRGIGVALYAWYLDKAADRIAREPKVMLQAHLGRVFNLGRCAAEQLAGRRRGHRACHSYFSLTSYLGSRYRCIVFYDITEESGCGQRAQNTLFAESLGCVQMVEHRWQDAA